MNILHQKNGIKALVINIKKTLPKFKLAVIFKQLIILPLASLLLTDLHLTPLNSLSSLVISIAFFALSVPLLTKTPTPAYLNTTALLMLLSRNQLHARSFTIQDFYDAQFTKYQSDFISQDFSNHQLCLLER